MAITAPDGNRTRYLELLKNILINFIYLEYDPSLLVVDANESPEVRRGLGRDWPKMALTMVGKVRLDNLQYCIEDILARKVPGDFVETGIWRGGSVILMRAVLEAYQVRDRIVWAADSFCGLPPPDTERFPADAGDPHSTFEYLRVPLETVKSNFNKFGLLDDQTRFVEGFFDETLPGIPVENLALLRLDGDMYGSTYVALESLYPKLSPGGFVIIDDYGVLPRCAAAVDDYRRANNIDQAMVEVDWSARFWIK